MKKFLSIVLSLTLVMALFAGCGSTKTVDKPTDAPKDAVESTEKEDNTEVAEEDVDGVKDVERDELTEVEHTFDDVEVNPDAIKGGILHFNIGADPKTIDPTLNGASDGGDVISQTFEGLTREVSGKVVPGIAKTWDVSEDGKTITFHLRESKWSDGTPLTAEDFVYSWKRGMNPLTASEYSWIWEYTNIKGAMDAVNFAEKDAEDNLDQEKLQATLDAVGVTAQDPQTLVVELTGPTDYLVSLLSFYHFMPVKQSAVEAEGGADGAWAKKGDLVVSNGPFTLTDYTIGEGLNVVKNPNYWNAETVYLDGINISFIDDATTAFQAYNNDELQFIKEVPPAETQRLINESDEFYTFPLLGTYYYNFNLDKEVWADVKVRKALTYAINRELICETLGTGEVPAVGMVPYGFRDADGNDFATTAGDYGVVTDGANIEKAKELLAEAGYPNGEGFPEFTLLYNNGEGHQKVAELVQEMWKTNLGLKVQLENQEWAVFQDTRKQGNFEMARGGWLTDFMDPMGLLGIFTSENSYNDANYNNSEYDAIIELANSQRGKEHYDSLYKAQEMFMNDMPIVPVYHYSDKVLVSNRIVGWDRSVLGEIVLAHAYLTEAE